LPPDEVRARIDEHFRDANPPVSCSVNTVSVEGLPTNSVYKIDADMQDTDVAVLEEAIKETFQAQLQTYAMEIGSLKQVEGTAAPGTKPAVGEAKKPGGEPPADARRATPAESEKATPSEQEAAKTDLPPAETTPATDAPAEPPATDPPAPAAEPGEAAPAPETPAADPAAPSSTENADGGVSRRSDLPADTVMAWAGPMTTAQDEPPGDAAQQPATAEPAAAVAEQPAAAPETAPATDAAAPQQPAPETVDDSAATTPDIESAPEPTAPEAQTRTVAQLTLGQPMSAPTLREKIRQAYNHVYGGDQPATGAATNAAGELTVPGLLVSVNEQFNWNQQSAATSSQWHVTMIASQADAEKVLNQLKTDLADTPVFPSSSKIGGKVAGDTRNLAIAALMASLFGIVGYIWIRFQRVVFGVAAVIALVHDVLITLGAIAISAYFAKSLGFLLIDEFRISLPIVAAFLTIIGYSLNDTIVVFDRIREVRGKSPDLTSDMINASINQTLSRTLLTSLTTLIVVIILYAIGGQGIHGFAFALVVGVVVGTYSSIFIASPVLLWMFTRSAKATS
jgi:SecD/SecF fusion protein